MDYYIAVCDDEQNEVHYIAGLAQQWARQKGIAVQVDTFLSAEAFLFQYEEKKNYDILLLDIEMGAMDGVSLARKLRKDNEILEIIFITGYSDYISEGYDVAALHYLLKPVNIDKLFSVLERAVDKLKCNERILTFEVSGEMFRIPIYEIKYAQVQLNYTTIYTRRDSVTIKMPLGKLMEQLDDRFCRAGRSIIVNLTYICRVTKKDIYLQDGTMIPLPRGAYEIINRSIINMR